MPFELLTPRLHMREIIPEDAEQMFLLNSDPEVVRYTGDGPFETLEAARIFLENYSDYKRNGIGRWLLSRRDTGEVLGWCGLKKIDDPEEIDLGYRLFRKHWGYGYATEAGEACLDYGFHTLRLPRIVARVHADNLASHRVVQKLNFTLYGDKIKEDGPWMLYERMR